MVSSNQLSPGMIISLNNKLYRVESSVKVTVAKGTPFIKATLRDLTTHGNIEKNFKINQEINEVAMAEKRLEFLYPEGKDYLFLDIGNLNQVLVPSQVVSDQVKYLKAGIELKAWLYGDTIFTVELPQFLELMVSKVSKPKGKSGNGNLLATLETGAEVVVPSFIDVGDIIKVDTKSNEWVQRV